MSSVFLRRKQQAAEKAPRAPQPTTRVKSAMPPVLFFQDTDSQASNGAASTPQAPKSDPAVGNTTTERRTSDGASSEDGGEGRSSPRHATGIEKLGELSREEDEYDFAILLKPVKYGDATGLYVVEDVDGDGDDTVPDETEQNGLRRRSTMIFGAGATVVDSSTTTQRAATSVPAHRGPLKLSGRELIVQRISRTGLVVKRLLSLDGRQTLLKVKAPQHVLEIGAERMKLRKLRRFDQIWMEFACELRETFADFDAALGGVRFIDSEKQSIVHMLLTTDVAAHGAGLNEFCPLKSKYVLKMFPLHKHRDLATLRRHWVAYWRHDPTQRPTAAVAAAVANGARRGVTGEVPRDQGSTEDDVDDGDAVDDVDATGSPEYIASCSLRTRRFLTHALSQPIDDVAQYYGERVAFYFAWTELYTRWLIVPSVAGTLLFVIQVQSKTLDHPLAAVYAVFMALWTSAFLLAWRRRAATLAYHWGTLGFEDAEITRPEFVGDPAVSSGNVKRYPAWKRYVKYAVTIPSVVTCIATVLVLTFLAFSTRDRLEQQSIAVRTRAKDVAHDIARDLENGLTLANLRRLTALGMSWDFWFYFLITPVLYGLLIPALDLVFTRLARALTKWENHETETRHQSHLILKVFSFRFVHVFASLYYYAFARGSRDDSLLRVAVQLASFMVSDQLWRNAMQTLYPFFLRRYAARRKKRDANEQFQHSAVFHAGAGTHAASASAGAAALMHRNAVIHEQCVRLEQASDRAWEEAELEPYDTFEDYTEMLIQFGYVTFFSLAFPLAPLLALCNNVFELRMDAFKLCHAKQRPIARKASGIGVWLDVLQLMSVLAVLTNCLHIAFTTSLVERLVPAISGSSKVWVVFAVEHVLLALKAWMTIVVPAMPSAVKQNVRREREHAKLESARAMASKIHLQQQQDSTSSKDSKDVVVTTTSMVDSSEK
ncbi:hypothetical protein P43SY_002788 [Pythium insidiosum]|uniref:Anoctamin transmembrane domain-containing protein n=1 Tax=Pythium insidiosum TaxID=114742 RepID=A0AAD5QBH3_PYTIN|nr:hypothetical protein P43SY_002788 [Pythium insidiosum]